MKYRRILIISTVAVFVLACVLSFVWFTKVRYAYVTVAADDEEGSVFAFAEKTLDDNFKGKSFLFVKKEDVEKALSEDPYVEIVSVKKVFPDKIEVALEKREERFSVYDGENYYYTDGAYHLLRVGNSPKEGVTEIVAEGTDIDLKSAALGEKLNEGTNSLFGYMTEIADTFSFPQDVCKNILIDGEKNRIYFNMKTGVSLSFRFGDVKAADAAATAKIIIDSAAEVEKAYSEGDESIKESGYILSYREDGKDVATVKWSEREEG